MILSTVGTFKHFCEFSLILTGFEASTSAGILQDQDLRWDWPRWCNRHLCHKWLYFGVCSEGVSASTMVDSGKKLLINTHNCRSCQSLVETWGLGIDTFRKVWCLVRKLPCELHRAQPDDGLWQEVIFAFSNYCKLHIFLIASILFSFDSYVIITRVVLKLACYQPWLVVLSEITVFGTTLKQSESVPMHLEENELIICADRLLLHTASSMAALNKRKVTKEESLGMFCFSVQKTKLTLSFFERLGFTWGKDSASHSNFHLWPGTFDQKKYVSPRWHLVELERVFVLYVPFIFWFRLTESFYLLNSAWRHSVKDALHWVGSKGWDAAWPLITWGNGNQNSWKAEQALNQNF